MTVVALAGRRIDSEGAEIARFPLEEEEHVKEQLSVLLEKLHPSMLVCSAACGADLLALEAAAELGIPTTVVLPFDRKRFRASSVVDRPGEWGPRFDRALKKVAGSGRVRVIAAESTSDDEAYALATSVILDSAEDLASTAPARQEGTAARRLSRWLRWSFGTAPHGGRPI